MFYFYFIPVKFQLYDSAQQLTKIFLLLDRIPINLISYSPMTSSIS